MLMKLTLAEPNKKWKYYVFDKFLYKLCFIGVKKKIDKERDTVCFQNRYWLWVFNTTVDEITGKRCYAENEVINMLEFYIDNTFFKLGGHIFKQIISISMETNCVPLFINLFLYSYEAEFIQKLIKDIIFSFFVGFSKQCLPCNF
jgi:hypothetical protein